MRGRCAIFSCKGLGDGLIILTLSHNLQINGYETVTFHPFLGQMQSWLPHLPIQPFPQEDELQGFDRFFIVYEKSPWMQKVLDFCLARYKEKTCVINPIATRNQDYPFWEQARFDGAFSFVDNLLRFSKEIVHLKDVIKGNGIVPPSGVALHKYARRVVIHPTSSREGKNWSKDKYVQLVSLLQNKGFDPVFLLTEEESQAWEDTDVVKAVCQDLGEMAALVAESSYMIGNDSGIGHLASCLNIPTVTICRNKMTARFWRPSWAEGRVCCPPSWIPNMKMLRLRDKYWQKWIAPSTVLRGFLEIATKQRA